MMCWAFKMLSYCQSSKKQVASKWAGVPGCRLRALTKVACCLIQLVQHKTGWSTERAGFCLSAEPGCSHPLLHGAVSMLLYRMAMELGKPMWENRKCLREVMQLLLLHGVEGGAMHPLQACLSWIFLLLGNTVHFTTLWVNNSVFYEPGIQLSKILEIFPYPPIPCKSLEP